MISIGKQYEEAEFLIYTQIAVVQNISDLHRPPTSPTTKPQGVSRQTEGPEKKLRDEKTLTGIRKTKGKQLLGMKNTYITILIGSLRRYV